MLDQNFINYIEIKEKIISYLKRTETIFEEHISQVEHNEQQAKEKINPNIFNFLIAVKDYDSGLSISIAHKKTTSYQIDVVSSVLFSSEHVNALKQCSEEEIVELIDSIHFWLLPRELKVVVLLNKNLNYENASYVVMSPIYEGELTFSNFMKALECTITGSAIATRLIQLNLNKYVDKTSLTEELNDE